MNYRLYYKNGSTTVIRNVEWIQFTGLSYIFHCDNQIKHSYQAEEVSEFGLA